MKVGLIICAYNRPKYLRQCLGSVAAAGLSQISTVWIVDDKSTDQETIKLIQDFELPGVELVKAFSKVNRSIKGSLLFGLDKLFTECDIVINLDGDAIVAKNFVNVLMDLKARFRHHIVTGFNCRTKNKNGSERHKVLNEGPGYNTKASVGGINMLFDVRQYNNFIRPALVDCIAHGGNWDHKSCISSMISGHGIICAVPSVVQHIGIDSSMGHTAGGEPPDVADDFPETYFKYEGGVFDGIWTTASMRRKMDEVGQFELGTGAFKKIQLPDVTLVAADCVDLGRVYKASDKCTNGIVFGNIKIFTSIAPHITPEPRCEWVIPIPAIKTKEDYSWFIMKDLTKHITTSHMLIFQHDGYVLNPSAWDPEWLQYDYIGAPWRFGDSKHPVGNGGFSLRSKKLMDIVANHPDIFPMNEPGVSYQKEEDHVIARMFGQMLTDNYGIKFAPIEVAEKFSIEAYGVKPPGNKYSGQFGFHGSHVDLST